MTCDVFMRRVHVCVTQFICWYVLILYTHLIRSLNFLTSFVNSVLYALLHCARIAIINVFNSCIVFCAYGVQGISVPQKNR